MTLAVAAQSAVAAWTLDEAAAPYADQVGSNDFSVLGAVASAAGKFDQAADFTGLNGHLLATNPNGITQLRVWVKLASKAATGQIIIFRGSDYSYFLTYNANSDGSWNLIAVQQATFNQSEVSIAHAEHAINVGQWYLLHACIDLANNRACLAVDATVAKTNPFDSFGNISSDNLLVGSAGEFEGVFFDPFNGQVDDLVLLANYILSADERTEDYNDGDGVAFADWAVVPAVPTNFPPLRGIAGANAPLRGVLNSQVPLRGILNTNVPLRGRP